jgi:hypothetical protein
MIFIKVPKDRHRKFQREYLMQIAGRNFPPSVTLFDYLAIPEVRYDKIKRRYKIHGGVVYRCKLKGDSTW